MPSAFLFGVPNSIVEAKRLDNAPNSFTNESNKLNNEAKKLINELKKFIDETNKFINEANKFTNKAKKLINEAKSIINETFCSNFISKIFVLIFFCAVADRTNQTKSL